MSKCTSCAGTGKTACPTCHGEGITTRTTPDGETVQRLCAFCSGDRQIRCGFCRGTGEVGTIEPAAAAAAAAARPRVAAPDRLAGKWKGVQDTWYEFVPDGPRYRTTAGGPRGVSGVGTATMRGVVVTIDATDQLCGHYQLELTLRGNQLDGIDRKAGFPLPVVFSRA